MKKFGKKFIIGSLLFLPLSFTSCDRIGPADLIVYGDNIYTANESGDFVEAFAVKDGKYIAVGSRDDVDKHKGNYTKFIHTKFAMPGATESHGHFILNEAFKLGCFLNPLKDDGTYKTPEELVSDVFKYKRENPGLEKIFGYGWGLFKNFSTVGDIYSLKVRELLDNAIDDIPVYLAEESLHGGWCNTKCLEIADVKTYDKDPGVNTILRDNLGIATGLIMDEACSYVYQKVFGSILDDNNYKTAVKNAATKLNSLGYTSHYDMWSNFDGTSNMYKAIHEVDESNELNCLYAGSYCIESFEKEEASNKIDAAVELKKEYLSDRFKPVFIKLFADGVLEAGSGYVKESYVDADKYGNGTRIWYENDMKSIVKESNEKDMLVHTHVMGDAAVEEAINSYIYSEEENGKRLRNSLGHVGLVQESDWERIKEHEIAIASGANWASQTFQEEIDLHIQTLLGEERFRSTYPYKEYIDNDIKAALSTDTPCGNGIQDVFGYLQVLIDGVDHSKPFNNDSIIRRTESFITLKDGLNMMTRNGAWMINLENERGSIEVGKYADFVFTDKDPFKQDEHDIWKVNITETYFEGRNVYTKEN